MITNLIDGILPFEDFGHKCGCISRKKGIVSRIHKHCEAHKPNLLKKRQKNIRKLSRKRGKGYTK